MADKGEGLSAQSALCTLRSARAQMDGLTSVLVQEFREVLPPGVVIREVVLAREQLLAAGVRAGLADAVDAAVRARVRAMLAEKRNSPFPGEANPGSLIPMAGWSAVLVPSPKQP